MKVESKVRNRQIRNTTKRIQKWECKGIFGLHYNSKQQNHIIYLTKPQTLCLQLNQALKPQCNATYCRYKYRYYNPPKHKQTYTTQLFLLSLTHSSSLPLALLVLLGLRLNRIRASLAVKLFRVLQYIVNKPSN